MIKKMILALAAVAACASCEKYIDLKVDRPERLLVVNGNVLAGEPVHTVKLAWSTFRDIRPVESAHLECFVNGTKVAETSDLQDVLSFGEKDAVIRQMNFSADFKPGDEVRITVEAGDVKVYVVSNVPAAPVIPSVDTSTVRTKDYFGDLTDHSLYEVNVQDVRGEDNYYRVVIDLDSEFYVDWVSDDEKQYRKGDILGEVTSSLDIDNSMEPLLRRKIGKDDDDSDWNFYNNRYNIFTDNKFRDSDYTMRLVVEHNGSLRNIDRYEYDENRVRLAQDRTVNIRVWSMPKLSYIYMNDYMFDHSDQGNWSFVSGIPYPSNVKGGTGLVTIMSQAECSVRLGVLREETNIWQD